MKEDITLQLSENALTAYCAFHHMFLHFASKLPALERIANESIDNFMKGSENRSKKVIPNLGTFLVLLNISKYSWKQISLTFLIECLERNVKWVSQKHPDILILEKDAVCMKRIDTTFKASIISLRLLMFQSHFSSTIGKPEGKEWRDILHEYNSSLGLPSPKMKEQLHAHAKSVLQVSSFPDFFRFVQIDTPSPSFFTSLLRQCVVNSKIKGYHKTTSNDRWSNNNGRSHHRGSDRFNGDRDFSRYQGQNRSRRND